jgi:CDGSH-type Zn-finger protein/uncharacterized Fe-S cluster protein YjdI
MSDGQEDQPKGEEYRGQKVVIRFDGQACVHSRNCVLGRPEVFRANVQGPWIEPDAADAEALVAVAQSCPSGAITYTRLDGRPDEDPPPVNLMRVRENGPLALHAQLRIAGQPRLRATLCRCGQSSRKPFCDGTHATAGFAATGEPETQQSPALPRRDGIVEVKPQPNGPLLIEGSVEVVTGTGRTITRTLKAAYCRCGGSENKPFCDGTHRVNGFRSE